MGQASRRVHRVTRGRLSLLSSEVILQGELNLPHIGRGAANLSEAGCRSDIRTAPRRVRAAPLHVIRSVKHLHAELDGLPLTDPEVLER